MTSKKALKEPNLWQHPALLLLPLILFLALIAGLLYYRRHILYPRTRSRQAAIPTDATAQPENEEPLPADGLRRRLVDAQESDQEEDDTASSSKPIKRIGKKKAESLRRKEERRQHREYMEMQRQDRLLRQELIQEEEEKKKMMEEKERLKQEAIEQRELEKKAKQEQREFEQWKKSFQVDEEGVSDLKEQSDEKWIEYITDSRVVLMEDVALHFNIKIQEAVERIKQLIESRLITGILDDRGRFISISSNQLQQLTAYMKTKGRFSKADIVRECNRIIACNT